jgi:hypothetical protein
MTRIGIVGHRFFNDDLVLKFVKQQTTEILNKALKENTNPIALSAIAEGADTLFAEAAIALDIPLEIVRPYLTYSSDFASASSQNCYNRLRTAARRETQLPYLHRSDEAYETAMKWIVMRSELLIAVWDGHPANGPGGTGNAVLQATQLGLYWIHLNVVDLTVTHHFAKTSNSISSEGIYETV